MTRESVSVLREHVFKAVGASGGEPHAELKAVFHPFPNGPYPLDRAFQDVGVRLPEEHRDAWLPMNVLYRAVNRVPEVHAHLSANPRDRSFVRGFIRDAIAVRSVGSTGFWRNRGAGYVQTQIAAVAKGIPNDMNAHNADLVAAHINRLKGKVPWLDIGTGDSAGTVFPIVEKLTAEAKRNVVLHLNCLQNQLPAIKGRLVRMGLKAGNIRLIRETAFAGATPRSADVTSTLDPKALTHFSGQKGRYRVITTGATLNNLPQSDAIFGMMSRMLRPGGRAFAWDWGMTYVRKPSLTREELDAPLGHITGGERPTVAQNIASAASFWFPKFGISQTGLDAFVKHVHTADNVNFMDWMQHHAPGYMETNKGYSSGGILRAYRSTDEVARSATRAGLVVRSLTLPLAKPDKLTVGNVTWHAVLEKPGGKTETHEARLGARQSRNPNRGRKPNATR